MAYDTATMAAAVREAERFAGGRVERVYQTARHEIVLALYHRGEKGWWLCSASPEAARAHLTGRLPERPATAPAFCMLLRRHLEGQRLLRLAQDPGERVLRVVVGASDDLGEPVEKHLVVEIMGRHSNVILLHPDGRVADAVKRIGPGKSRYRQVVPGAVYAPPPPAPGREARLLSREDLAGVAPDLPLWRALVHLVRGAGPTLARQACLRSGLDPDLPAARLGDGSGPLVQAVGALAQDVLEGRFSPNVLEGPAGEPLEFWVLPLLGPGARRDFASVADMLDHVYACLERRRATRVAVQQAESLLRRELDRLQGLRAEVDRALAEAADAEELHRRGEILIANLYRLKEGLSEAVLPDHLDPAAGPVQVTLDPRLSPAENAQALFRRAARARRAAKALVHRRGEVDEEQVYLAAKLAQLESAGDGEPLLDELAARGYRTGVKGSTSRPPAARPPFARYRTTAGLLVLVGRNNRENEELTLRHAGPADVWLHAREMPGSHVILKTAAGAPPAASLRQAAEIAAWHSRGRRSSQVAVDYTERRNVRKPPGAPPGKVIYHAHKTIYVTPSEEAVTALREP
ncbi:MAG: NFACT family protein [bacterium]|nr:NFACT family protein [bacterium]